MDIQPYADLTKPYHLIENIEIKHPDDQSRGKVHIKRVFIFQKEEESLTISALQAKTSHTDTYKLGTDVNNRILVKLTDFLKLPSVIEAGITLKEAQSSSHLLPCIRLPTSN